MNSLLFIILLVVLILILKKKEHFQVITDNYVLESKPLSKEDKIKMLKKRI